MNPELMKRVKKTQAEARAKLAKRGVMRFRCREEDILRLNDFAQQQGTAAGTLIRDWVLERLNYELAKNKTTTIKMKQGHKKTNSFMYVTLEDVHNILKSEVVASLKVFENRLKTVEKATKMGSAR